MVHCPPSPPCSGATPRRRLPPKAQRSRLLKSVHTRYSGARRVLQSRARYAENVEASFRLAWGMLLKRLIPMLCAARRRDAARVFTPAFRLAYICEAAPASAYHEEGRHQQVGDAGVIRRYKVRICGVSEEALPYKKAWRFISLAGRR